MRPRAFNLKTPVNAPKTFSWQSRCGAATYMPNGVCKNDAARGAELRKPGPKLPVFQSVLLVCQRKNGSGRPDLSTSLHLTTSTIWGMRNRCVFQRCRTQADIERIRSLAIPLPLSFILQQFHGRLIFDCFAPQESASTVRATIPS